MYFHDPNFKYDLLRLVITLWVTFIVLVLLVRHKLPPNKHVHNIVNVLLALSAVAQFVAIVYISLRFSFY